MAAVAVLSSWPPSWLAGFGELASGLLSSGADAAASAVSDGVG
jgi:hypothetical protein